MHGEIDGVYSMGGVEITCGWFVLKLIDFS